jgi:hypothetical protein
MFLGHYGAALALKRAEPKVSLGTLFLAVQLVDLLWSAFVLLGWERVRIVPDFAAASPLEFLYYPITHSLLAGVLWALVAAALYYTWPTRDTARHWQAALVVGAAVVSHWFIDLIVHLPDLPLTGADDSPKLGLGLWRSLPGTLAAELLFFGIGLLIYVRRGSRRHPVRRGRLALLTGILLASFLSSFLAPPPGVVPIAASALIFFPAIAALAAWADRAAGRDELKPHHEPKHRHEPKHQHG